MKASSVESGQYFVRPGPSSWSHAPAAAVSACSPGSGLRSTCARMIDAGAAPSAVSRSTSAPPCVPCWVWTPIGAPVRRCAAAAASSTRPSKSVTWW